MPPLATSILLTLAAALVLEFTATGRNGGSPAAVVATLVLVAGHAWALGFRRWIPAPRFVIGRAGALASACVVALLALETLSNQASTVAMIPVRAREAAQLGQVILAAERMNAGGAVYREYLPMEGYEAHVSAMPGLLAAYLIPRNTGLDWRFASLAGEVLAAAFAVGMLVPLSRRPRAGAALAAITAGFLGIFLLPSAASAVSWSTHAPMWAATAAFSAGLVWGMPTLAGIAAGVLAAMSVGWLVLLPAAFSLVWSIHREKSLPGMVLGGVIAVSALMTARPEFAPFLAGVVGGPMLMADPRQAADLEPWLFPTLTGALTTFKLAPPLLVWAGLWALRAAWVIARGSEPSRALEHFALAAFIVLICGPATMRFDLLSMALLAAGLLSAQVTMLADASPHESSGPLVRATPALATVAAATVIAAPVMWRLARPHPLSLDLRANAAQSNGEHLLSGWHEPPGASGTWARAPHAEVAFPVSRHAPATIEVELSVPPGEFTPYNPIRIYLNQRRVGEWVAEPGQRFTAVIPVRDPRMFIRGPNVLSFEADWAKSERELGIGSSIRPIAFAYHGLRFTPTTARGDQTP